MRILHFQKASGIGGSERHLLLLLPALAAAGAEVRIAVATSGEGTRFVQAMRDAGVECVAAPAGPDVNPLLTRWAATQARRFDADVLHTHLIHADLHGQPAALLAGAAGVSSMHGTPAFLRRPPMRQIAAAVGRLPRRTIAISRGVASFIDDLGLRPPGTVRVVQYGLDATRWHAPGDARQLARERYGFDDGDVVVAITARLIAGKGHDLLLDAVRLALPRAPRLRLLIAGNGPTAGEVERAAASLPAGTVHLTGFLDDVRPVVWAADVLAFPTDPRLGEGFGLAALEAAAAGRPVVVTAVGGLAEVVPDGVTGRVVAPRRPDDFAGALVDLANDSPLREAMGARAGVRAARDFGVEAMVDRTLEVYEEAVTLARRPRAALSC